MCWSCSVVRWKYFFDIPALFFRAWVHCTKFVCAKIFWIVNLFIMYFQLKRIWFNVLVYFYFSAPAFSYHHCDLSSGAQIRAGQFLSPDLVTVQWRPPENRSKLAELHVQGGIGCNIFRSGHRIVAMELRIHHGVALHDDKNHSSPIHSVLCSAFQTWKEGIQCIDELHFMRI